MSFFILPYVVAAVLWLRDRNEWKAFVRLFVGLSFVALVIYAILPAAPRGPPRAAPRRCRRRSVGSVVHAPVGAWGFRRGTPWRDQISQDGANNSVERIVAGVGAI